MLPLKTSDIPKKIGIIIIIIIFFCHEWVLLITFYKQ